MKITFVHSPEDFYDQNYGTRFTPLWAYYLASYVPPSWGVEIVDCRTEDISVCAASDIFAFGGINQDLKAMTKTMERLKKRFPKSAFLLGGPITWSFEKEGKLHLLDRFDYLFLLDGEESLPHFLLNFEKGIFPQEKIIKTQRFSFDKAKKPRLDILDRKQCNDYYGAVIEVSRGCPFLCEFCDIRVLPNNNQTNTKNISLIIDEVDEYYKRGITQFQFACDNFIGNIQWANACCDALLEWKERAGAKASFFTWLTINLYKMPSLMEKMRKIGFSILFIGIESVNRNSLLETAKVQNMNVLEDAVKTIHSFGFIIAPGLIFGFDSDTEKMFEETLDFLKNTGTLGGDPSFLTALAGTPLYTRMKKSGRLSERPEQAIERKKVATNIRYLQDKDFLTKGFLYFAREFIKPGYQYSRFKTHVDLILQNSHFIPNENTGYASPFPYLKRQIKNTGYMTMLGKRILFLSRPDRFWAACKGWWLTKRYASKAPGLGTHLFYWLYVWTNLVLKYQDLRMSDFSLESVDESFDRSALPQAVQISEMERLENQKEGIKVDIQSRYTKQALQQLANSYPAK
ncbi:MAG: hypothetical protein A3H42_06900 [Deltaproteobacteria bacterium RIFCSPLOWO2_02_FULL_46_8]|nr:MAG: hypothetical protein A3H42_06900 [Deltaproteobacteria bacterium RIFCSPLOWO2_02_FULL_46_8]